MKVYKYDPRSPDNRQTVDPYWDFGHREGEIYDSRDVRPCRFFINAAGTGDPGRAEFGLSGGDIPVGQFVLRINGADVEKYESYEEIGGSSIKLHIGERQFAINFSQVNPDNLDFKVTTDTPRKTTNSLKIIVERDPYYRHFIGDGTEVEKDLALEIDKSQPEGLHSRLVQKAVVKLKQGAAITVLKYVCGPVLARVAVNLLTATPLGNWQYYLFEWFVQRYSWEESTRTYEESKRFLVRCMVPHMMPELIPRWGGTRWESYAPSGIFGVGPDNVQDMIQALNHFGSPPSAYKDRWGLSFPRLIVSRFLSPDWNTGKGAQEIMP